MNYGDKHEEEDERKEDFGMAKVFTIFSLIGSFKVDPDIISNEYEYYLFFLEEVIGVAVEHLEQAIKSDVYRFWLPMYSLASLLYCIICIFVANYISWSMVRPINALTRRIYRSIHSIR